MSHCWTVRCKTCEKRCEEDVNKGRDVLIHLITGWPIIRQASDLLSGLPVDLLPLLADDMRFDVEVLEFIDAHYTHELQVVSEYPNVEPVEAPKVIRGRLLEARTRDPIVLDSE
jgi:hypothetical protein